MLQHLKHQLPGVDAQTRVLVHPLLVRPQENPTSSLVGPMGLLSLQHQNKRAILEAGLGVAVGEAK